MNLILLIFIAFMSNISNSYEVNQTHHMNQDYNWQFTKEAIEAVRTSDMQYIVNMKDIEPELWAQVKKIIDAIGLSIENKNYEQFEKLLNILTNNYKYSLNPAIGQIVLSALFHYNWPNFDNSEIKSMIKLMSLRFEDWNIINELIKLVQLQPEDEMGQKEHSLDILNDIKN